MSIVSFLNHVLLVLPGVGIKLNCKVLCGKNVQPYCNAHWTINGQLVSQGEGCNQTQQTWACANLNSWSIIINIINRYPLVQNQKKPKNKNKMPVGMCPKSEKVSLLGKTPQTIWNWNVELVAGFTSPCFWSRADVVKNGAFRPFNRDTLRLAGRQLVAKSLSISSEAFSSPPRFCTRSAFPILPDIGSALSTGARSPLHPTSTGKTATFFSPSPPSWTRSWFLSFYSAVVTTNLFLFARVNEPVSKNTIATAVLTIERVSSHHFRSEFTCHGNGFYKTANKSITLKQRGQCRVTASYQ